MATKEEVLEALKSCYDPEIPVNIVDLGLVYEVRIDGGTIGVEMTLTARGCGMGEMIAAQAQDALRAIPGVSDARVELVFDPPWSPERISPEGRKSLGIE